MKHPALNVVCLLVAGVALLAFPPKAGAQCTPACQGGECTNNPDYSVYDYGCPSSGKCNGPASMQVIVPYPPVSYGVPFDEWFPYTCEYGCCSTWGCDTLGEPEWAPNGCQTGIALRHDVKPNEGFARGLDRPLFFVRGCDGEYRVISFVSAS
jgi:hypothetical protein